MNEIPKAALLFMGKTALRLVLADRLATAGYEVDLATPDDLSGEPAWRARVAARTNLALLVHYVQPPDGKIGETSFTEFQTAFETVIGSLWTGGKASASLMRVRGGGVIIVLVPPHGDPSMMAMFGDGLRSLAACLGAGFADATAAVRVFSVAAGSDSEDDLATAELIAFLVSDGCSYATATSVDFQRSAAHRL